jgi:endo-1,4-beta-D-glucanase Y
MGLFMIKDFSQTRDLYCQEGGIFINYKPDINFRSCHMNYGNNIQKISLTILCFFLSLNIISGQHKPFPRNIDYPFGYMPATVTHADAQYEYNRWKNLYLVTCNDMYRVATTDNEQTLSEGTGYGMLLTAYYGEKDYFDGLLEFYKSKRTSTANGLMAWNVTCEGINDPNCATDGDIDAAFALIVAYNQWGGRYLEEAREILGKIKSSLMISCGDTIYALKPGVGWGGCYLTDISYYPPACFRIFAEITGDTSWSNLADDTYAILNAGAHETTGLVPDWQSVDGTPSGKPPQPDRIGYFRYDASRVPWRIGLDYLWNGNTLAQEWCNKITDWASGIGATNIVDGYYLDGSVEGQYHNSSFVGGFTIGAMCNSQDMVDNFAVELKTLYDQHYFNLSVKCLYLLTATGNFWKPETEFTEVTSITVTAENGVDTVSLDQDTIQMIAHVLPDSAFNKEVEWAIVTGTGIATISESGLLTLLDEGTVMIAAKALDGSFVTGVTTITIINGGSSVASFQQPDITYAPNPFDNTLFIDHADAVIKIEILGINGKVITSIRNDSKNSLAINTSGFADGIYILKINTIDGSVYKYKVIKQ